MNTMGEVRKAIESTYQSICCISRYGKYKDPITKEKRNSLILKVKEQPCKLSRSLYGKNNQTEIQNDIQYQSKLFIAPEIEIEQGDKVEVLHFSREYIFYAGEPFIYQTHQEVLLSRVEKA